MTKTAPAGRGSVAHRLRNRLSSALRNHVMCLLKDGASNPGGAGIGGGRRLGHAHGSAAGEWPLVDRLFILAVLLWGNWAIYYWTAVLGFNASFRSLRLGLPILLVQVVASAWLVRHWKLPAGCREPAARPAGPLMAGASLVRVWLWAVGAMVGLSGLAGVIWATGISHSPVGYNLAWSLMLPPFLAAYALLAGISGDGAAGGGETVVANAWAGSDRVIFALVCATGFWAATFFGCPGPDDAFYAHVMSSSIAHPDLPVQGQDLLLGTSAPYTIHPGYRASGFEVLAALIADLAHCDPLWVTCDLYPLAGVLFWGVASHVFLRSLGLPVPGLGTAAALALLLFWTAAKGPGIWFGQLHHGKGYLATIVAPLIFGTVAAYVGQRDRSTWLVAVLAVCAALGWTSSAMFVVPASLILATVVYLPWSTRSLPVAAVIGIMAAPAAGLIVATSRVVAAAPPRLAGGGDTGEVLVGGESLGGIRAMTMMFATLLVLPLVARVGCGAACARVVRRLAVVGSLSVFAPYWIEACARLGGVSLLSWRMPWAFPSSLLVGVLACLLVAAAAGGSESPARRRIRIVSVTAFLAWVFLWGFTGSPPWSPRSIVAIRAQRRRSVEPLMDDAREIRALLSTRGPVAAGYVNDLLPILPDPPSFVAVRFYLGYHQGFLSEEEFARRMEVNRVLVHLSADVGCDAEKTAANLVANIRRLGITSVVFAATPAAAAAAQWPYGQHREPMGSVAVIDAITRGLSAAGFECRDISSGRARVCRLPSVAPPKPESAEQPQPGPG